MGYYGMGRLVGVLLAGDVGINSGDILGFLSVFVMNVVFLTTNQTSL